MVFADERNSFFDTRSPTHLDSRFLIPVEDSKLRPIELGTHRARWESVEPPSQPLVVFDESFRLGDIVAQWVGPDTRGPYDIPTRVRLFVLIRHDENDGRVYTLSRSPDQGEFVGGEMLLRPEADSNWGLKLADAAPADWDPGCWPWDPDQFASLEMLDKRLAIAQEQVALRWPGVQVLDACDSGVSSISTVSTYNDDITGESFDLVALEKEQSQGSGDITSEHDEVSVDGDATVADANEVKKGKTPGYLTLAYLLSGKSGDRAVAGDKMVPVEEEPPVEPLMISVVDQVASQGVKITTKSKHLKDQSNLPAVVSVVDQVASKGDKNAAKPKHIKHRSGFNWRRLYKRGGTDNHDEIGSTEPVKTASYDFLPQPVAIGPVSASSKTDTVHPDVSQPDVVLPSDTVEVAGSVGVSDGPAVAGPGTELVVAGVDLLTDVDAPLDKRDLLVLLTVVRAVEVAWGLTAPEQSVLNRLERYYNQL